MLFVYGSFPVGGIETFFVRMAKERSKIGLDTSIILLARKKDCNSALLNEMEKYSKVLFPEDIFTILPSIARQFPLLAPINKKNMRKLLANADQVHAFDGMHALFGERVMRLLNRKIPVTIGFYHYIKYLWGGNNIPFYEKLNRKFIFDYLPKECLLFFSEGNRQLYSKYKCIDFSSSQTFRLGVVDSKNILLSGELGNPVTIVAVGRLVEFKTYNFYMLEVIKNLRACGFDVRLDIYGNGPLKEKLHQEIISLGVSESVFLKGEFDYSYFDEVVSQYDIFIGSGTAIIQSASLGVPSIVGVENTIQPKTYGYFCDVHEYEYNLKGLDLPFLDVQRIIEDFIAMDVLDRLNLKKEHVNSIRKFTNDSCQNAMNSLKNINMPFSPYIYNKWLYELSRFLDRINMKFNKNHPRLTQFDDFKKLEEK